MTRRREPRPLALAVDAMAADLIPPSTLARVQRCWAAVAGPAVAAEAEPALERDGVVTIACRSSVWAQELHLLSDGLVQGLNRALGGPPGPPAVRGLRFVATDPRREA